ncbi:hypothetical protein OAA47_02800 [Methylophilaceae bacterium]|nr:hypothetical protein [Methylophilaceae bacterium]
MSIKTIIVVDTNGENGAKLLDNILNKYNIKNYLIVTTPSVDTENYDCFASSNFIVMNKVAPQRKNYTKIKFKDVYKHGLPYVILLVEEKLNRRIYESWAMYFLSNTSAKRLLLLNERMLPSSSFSRVFRANNKCIHVVQHGNIVDNYFPSFANIYYVWGSYYKEVVLANESKKIKPHIIGYPKKNKVYDFFSSAKFKQPTILFCTQLPNSSLNKECVDEINKLVVDFSEKNGFSLYIKLHPLDNPKNWNFLPSSLHHTVSYDWPYKIDVFVVASVYSTVLIELANAGFVVVQIAPVKYLSNIEKLFSDASVPCLSTFFELDAEFKRLQNIEYWNFRKSDQHSSMLKYIK